MDRLRAKYTPKFSRHDHYLVEVLGSSAVELSADTGVGSGTDTGATATIRAINQMRIANNESAALRHHAAKILGCGQLQWQRDSYAVKWITDSPWRTSGLEPTSDKFFWRYSRADRTDSSAP